MTRLVSDQNKHPSPSEVGAPGPSPLSSRHATLSSSLHAISNASSSSPIVHSLLISLIDISLLELKHFLVALDASESEEATELPSQWKDEIDGAGVRLWNFSTSFKFPLTEEQGNSMVVVIARLRLLAFKLISLGSVPPLSSEVQVSFLTLATKASDALLQAGDTAHAVELLEASAAFVDTLSALATDVPGLPKALLSHYCARVEASIKAKNMSVARWMMEKAKDLCSTGSLSEREVERVAGVAYAAGAFCLSNSKPGHTGSQPDDSLTKEADEAVHWLLTATSLIEGQHDHVSKDLQLLILKKLAQAYLEMAPSQSALASAESTISEIITIAPTLTLWRRYIKIISVRKGGDGELVEAFTRASAMLDPWSETEGSELLRELGRFPDEQRLLRFSILAALASSVASRPLRSTNSFDHLDPEEELGKGDAGFMAQIVMAAFISVIDDDVDRIGALLNHIPNCLSLARAPAFFCVTFLWNQGDKLHRESKPDLAHQWYLLATHRAFNVIESVALPKSYRKAALCLLEVQEFDRASKLVSAVPNPDAKTRFVLFYIAVGKRDPAQAISNLKSLLQAPGFSLELLLWAGRCAQESGMKPVILAVLEGLLLVCRTNPSPPNVDVMVLIRCLIRLIVASMDDSNQNQEALAGILCSHFQTSLQMATTLSTETTDASALVKNLEWLQKTGYNLCLRFSTAWPPQILSDMFSTTASLIDLADRLSLDKNPDAPSKLWICRLSALSTQAGKIRELNSTAEKVAASLALLPNIRTLRQTFQTFVRLHLTLPRAVDIDLSIVSLEMEILATVSDWEGIWKLVEENKSNSSLPPRVFKMIVKAALNSKDCPHETVCKLLKQTVTILFSRSDLNAMALASWLRAIICSLLGTGCISEAFQYMKKAVHIVDVHGATYPSDEAKWLIATAWDKGLDHFYAQSPEAGREWCGLAVSVATKTDPALGYKIASDLETLCNRFDPPETRS